MADRRRPRRGILNANSLSVKVDSDVEQLAQAAAELWATQNLQQSCSGYNPPMAEWIALFESIPEKQRHALAMAVTPKPRLPVLSQPALAVYLTVLTFIVFYIATGLVIKHDPELATLSKDNGPTPFEIAMGAGALTFWATNTHLPPKR
jgi:hypothetical protein